MSYTAIKQHVANRGVPPESFLEQLIAWGKVAPSEIFAYNQYSDIYSSVKNVLGPWQGDLHRRAVMLEVLRVLAGFESSWNWEEGPDKNTPASKPAATKEAGAWQVSADSMGTNPELKKLIVNKIHSTDPDDFQKAMKMDHPLAMEYIARLLRFTTHHHGPVLNHHIDPWLRQDAVEEFKTLLGAHFPASFTATTKPLLIDPYKRNNDFNLLHPTVRTAVKNIEKNLQDLQIPFKVFEAFRSPQRQAELYAQGRTKPGKIVTYAKPWYSYHQYGLAADFVLYEQGQWSWDDSTPAKKKWWAKLHELGKKYGLARLDFETPHLQIAGTSTNALTEGVYPVNGDESWAENLTANIKSWHSLPPAPPTPAMIIDRPAL